MRELSLSARDFDAAVCLFDSIGYVAKPEAVVQVYRRVHEHVRKAGLLIVEFWHAPAMLRHFEPVRVRRWTTPEGEIVRISETSLDDQEQTARVVYSIDEFRSDGTHASFRETQVNRFFHVEEMTHLLEQGGFEPVASFAGFCVEQPITERTFHILTIARRSHEDRCPVSMPDPRSRTERKPVMCGLAGYRRNADLFLILPYSFVDAFAEREAEWLRNGGKFLVPLPQFHILSA